jgi:hypothetical protein
VVVRRVGLAVVLALALAPSAQARARLGPVQRAPSAVTDAAGTLHVVSGTTLGQPDGVPYCRVPAGGKSCSYSVLLTGYPSVVVDPHLLLRRQDGALILVANGVPDDGGPDATFVQISADGGSSWTAPRIAGRGLFDIESAVLTPDGTAVDTVSVQQDAWQRVPLGGGVETRTVALGTDPAGTKGGLGSELGTLGDGRPIIGSAPGDSVRVRVLNGDPYVNANWTAWKATPRVRDLGFHFASGPKGFFMATDAARHQRLWRWNGHRFKLRGSLHRGLTADTTTAVIAEDGQGRIHAAWRQVCGRRFCLVYRRGFGRRVVHRWQPTRTGRRPEDPIITVNAAGHGWIVFTDGSYVLRHGDVALPFRA